MKSHQFLTILCCILGLSFQGVAAVLHVPASYPTIQDAIYASANGDIILVEPNTYYEHVDLGGKNVTLCSEYFITGNPAFIASTIIDGSNNGRPVTVSQYETTDCRIIGFTIQHGYSPWAPDMGYGGGIMVWHASPQISNCVIQNNYASTMGGGICIGENSASIVKNCTIKNNISESFGGGLYIGDCSTSAAVIDCIITGNINTSNSDFNGSGGGVSIYHTGKLENCLISGNSAPNSPAGGGGVFCDWGDLYGSQEIFVTGCTIVKNHALNYGGTSYVITGGEFRNCIIWGNSDTTAVASNVYGNMYTNCCTTPYQDGTGNIDSDPAFTNFAGDVFTLQTGSTCINAGDNLFSSQLTDLNGNPRIHDTIVDMGAYEYGSGGSTVQVGSGTDQTGMYPINTCYGYNYSQQIYLGSEISSAGGASGLVTKLRFFYFGGGTQISNWHNWTIFMGNTPKTQFDSASDWVPVSTMKQVFSGIIPNPAEGSWVEINLPIPFYYTGSNVVVAINENSSGWDCTAQWSSFYTDTPRGLITYDDNLNPDPLSPPIASSGPDNIIAQVQFEINPVVGIIQGHVNEETNCTSPIAGASVVAGPYSTVSDSTGYYQMIVQVGSYDVIAYYHNGAQTSPVINVSQGQSVTQDFCLPPYFAPPVQLEAKVLGTSQNNVHLTWLPPGAVADQYIHWDNGTIYGGLGYLGPATFSVASRWPVEDIAPYNGTYLKKIRFVPDEATASYTLKVWKGTDASTLLLSQVVNDPYINAWNEITLNTPILIDGTQELWFGYEITQTTGYPAGLGSGPAVAGKGDMINSGYGWFSVKNSWGWEFNWTIQGFISENPVLSSQKLVPLVQGISQQPAPSNPAGTHEKPQFIVFDQLSAVTSPLKLTTQAIAPVKTQANGPVKQFSPLTGYNVYRNDVKIADNVSDIFYDDNALAKGGYDYQVSAQYSNGESERIGPVHVSIYTCFPPTNLTVLNSTLTTTTADLSWTPSTLSTSSKWQMEWGPRGFTQGYGTMVTVMTNPQLTITGLNPGNEYDFYVRTYCNPDDSSAWVMKTFRTHYFDCPAGSVPEAEVCGTNTNGCDLVPPAFESISPGEIICGTAWLHRTYRDSDWYTFTITQPADITITGNSEFNSTTAISVAPCPATTTLDSSYSWAGYNNTIKTRLESAGSYFINIVPTFDMQISCDSLNRYWIKLAANTCLTPTNLSAGNFTSTSVDLSWTSGAGSWNLEYGPAGFAQNSGTMISGTVANPYHLSGLVPGYAYSYYVQALCPGGGMSSWAGPYTFFLPCSATSLPYSENFTAMLVGATPQCWQDSRAGGSSSWKVDFTNYAGGTSPELALLHTGVYFQDSSYIVSPILRTTGKTSLTLSFKHNIDWWSIGTTGGFSVLTTSNGGITWHNVWALNTTVSVNAVQVNIDIANSDVGSANFQFAFVYKGYFWDLGSWRIDDIALDGPPYTGTLQGIVRRCSTATLQGVTVSAGTSTTTTNASGFYQLADLTAGTYNVAFSLPGYVSKTVNGVAILNGQVTTLDTCLVVAGPPVNNTIQNDTVHSGQTSCFDASQIINVAGSSTTFIVENGGSAEFIAGQKIAYHPGTWIKHGAYMHGRIAPTGPYCGFKSAENMAGAGETSISAAKPVLKVYPNPTTGNFRMELSGVNKADGVKVEIFGIRGDRVLSEVIPVENMHEFSLEGASAGIYFIKVTSGDTLLTTKLVKTK